SKVFCNTKRFDNLAVVSLAPEVLVEVFQFRFDPGTFYLIFAFSSPKLQVRHSLLDLASV
ncbi:MAG: hypothetical protein HOP07_15440, partial [Bacteriovoracaceae bacterium]|nr:hypothetical protein [Bacteriovoracaceae bacterium]